MIHAGLSGIALPQLQLLLRLVRSGDLPTPLSATAVQARGLGAHWPDLAWLKAIDRPGIEAVLSIAISERTTRPVPRLELVWTGPEAKVSAARDTAVVVRDLFSRAHKRVLVAGYAFKGGRDIFEPLQVAMTDRGVEAHIIIHIDDRPGMAPDDAARRGVDEFLRDNWPFAGPVPSLYYDPRTVAAGSSINLHAKCIVVDHRFTLIGSANFTHNAHARNIEVGVLIEDVCLAMDLERQWQGLADAGLIMQVRDPKRS